MRERLDGLAADGRFYVACARTGERPFPAGGLRFADRETGADAAVTLPATVAVLRRVPTLDPSSTAWATACARASRAAPRD